MTRRTNPTPNPIQSSSSSSHHHHHHHHNQHNQHYIPPHSRSRSPSPLPTRTHQNHDSDSDSDSDSSITDRERTYRNANRMGGLSKAAEEMFVNGPARRRREREMEREEEEEREIEMQMEEERRARDHGYGPGRGRRANESMHDGYYGGVEREMNRREDPYAQTGYERRTHRGVSGSGDRSAYSETESDFPTTSRHYEGRGFHARGDYFYDDEEEEYYDGPSTPRGYGARGGRTGRDEYEYEDENEDRGSGGDRGRRVERSRWL